MLAFRHETLHPIRARCEAAGIPVAWRQELPPLTRVREIAAFLDRLTADRRATLSAAALETLLPDEPTDWRQLLVALIADWRLEAGDLSQPSGQIADFCYETLAEQRREPGLGAGVLLSTLHGVKGMEFDHVCIADGPWSGDADLAQARRLFYVGMTRGRATLTLGRLPGGGNPDPALFSGDWLLRTAPRPTPATAEQMARRYHLLGLPEIDLGFAGRQPPEAPVHRWLAALAAGDRLTLLSHQGRLQLCDGQGRVVGRLSQNGSVAWLPRLERVVEVRLVAILRRRREDGDPGYRDRYRCPTWEVPLVELVWLA